MEYIVYGMVDPISHKIAYIDWMTWNWNFEKDYPTERDYLEYSLDEMNTNDEYDNPYWLDLARLYDNVDIEIVVLDKIENDEETAERLKERYINLLKPRYNNWNYYNRYFNEMYTYKDNISKCK